MTKQPSVLWLTLESTRADHTPMYGYDRNTTPNLAKLANREDAVLLENMVSASNWTRPSTASMLTGTHYSTHNTGGRGARGTKLPDHLDTLPEYLSNRGYDTALFSPAPQISSDTGLDRGFDHYELIDVGVENFFPGSEYFSESWRTLLHHLISEPGWDPLEAIKDADDMNLMQFLRFKNWFQKRDRSEQPYFAYAHIWSPHSPFQPIKRYRDFFFDNIEMNLNEAYEFAIHEYQNLTEKIANGEMFSDREWAAMKALYDSEVRYADEMLGKMVDLAGSASDDLIIIVTGDHGELFGEKEVISHKITLHDGAIKVPGVVVGIDGVKNRDGEMSQHIDLTKTVGEVLNVPTSQFEGRDLRGEMREFAIAQRREWDFSDYTDINPDFDHNKFIKEPYTAVCAPEFKLIESDTHQLLYELPNEDTDVSEEYPEVVKSMTAEIDRQGIEWDDAFERDTATFDNAAEQRLRDLGYLS